MSEHSFFAKHTVVCSKKRRGHFFQGWVHMKKTVRVKRWTRIFSKGPRGYTWNFIGDYLYEFHENWVKIGKQRQKVKCLGSPSQMSIACFKSGPEPSLFLYYKKAFWIDKIYNILRTKSRIKYQNTFFIQLWHWNENRHINVAQKKNWNYIRS